jgi:hypothetical protein
MSVAFATHPPVKPLDPKAPSVIKAVRAFVIGSKQLEKQSGELSSSLACGEGHGI